MNQKNNRKWMAGEKQDSRKFLKIPEKDSKQSSKAQM